MSEPMYTAEFAVTLRLPERITPEQALQELRTCISFGHPEVQLRWVLPDPIEQDIPGVPRTNGEPGDSRVSP